MDELIEKGGVAPKGVPLGIPLGTRTSDEARTSDEVPSEEGKNVGENVDENVDEKGSLDDKENYTELFSDLHIHSRYSRACSKELNIDSLVKWARIKGVGLLGTGDFTHNEWLSELKEKLVEKEINSGIYYYSDSEGDFPFILTHEISLIYTQDGKGRRVHLVSLVPDFNCVDKINSWLDTLGRRDYDGRPIFKISCRDFAAKMEEIDERIEIIPAHIWTPYFGVFGSMGGFDSLKDAFLDKTHRIHAIETGISSDPEMNWKIKNLENISIVSFSDSHSFWPWRLGREATIFRIDGELSYDMIIKQIRENSFIGTIETDPAYGKYHWDGHAKCGFSCSPAKTRELNEICPKCGKKLVIGVDNQVEKLSEDSEYLNKKKYYTLLPLHEIISLGLGVGMNSKGVWNIYNKLMKEFGNEFEILLKVNEDELRKIVDKNLVDLILKNRVGDIKVKAGYDGVYGTALLEGKKEEQRKLF